MTTATVLTAAGAYVGRVVITPADWRGATTWEEAARAAVRRTYAPRRPLSVEPDRRPEDEEA